MSSNIRKASNLSISVDVDAVLNELDFLKAVNDDGVDFFYQPEFIQNALRRYEKFWVPFVAQMSTSKEDDLQFSPPTGNKNYNKFLCKIVLYS